MPGREKCESSDTSFGPVLWGVPTQIALVVERAERAGETLPDLRLVLASGARIGPGKIALSAGTDMVITTGKVLHPLKAISEIGRASCRERVSSPV